MLSFNEHVERTRALVSHREQLLPLDELRDRVRTAPASKDALAALRVDGRAVSVIAEVKRTSATFADLSGVGDTAVLARFYEAGGAACVSVVTESILSQGAIADLDAVRAAVDVPVAINDLIVTPYQVHEARAHGADLLKLDARLDPLILESLIERAASLGMVAFVEAHGPREAMTALEVGARCIAVDARDPHTFAIDPSRFAQVAALIPESVLRLACGGVTDAHDVMDYARAGADVVIVGEAVIRSADPQAFVAQLVAAGSHPSLLTAIQREGHAC